MTEKRFTMDNECDIIEFDWENNEYLDDFMWGDGKSWDRVCNRLNELYEENEQLKIDLGIADDVHKLDREIIDDLHLSYKKLEKEKKELQKENEELKSENNRIVNETAKVVAEHQKRVLDLIDDEIDDLEKRYKFGQEVYHGCPMHNIRFGINVLKELKKELQE